MKFERLKPSPILTSVSESTVTTGQVPHDVPKLPYRGSDKL